MRAPTAVGIHCAGNVHKSSATVQLQLMKLVVTPSFHQVWELMQCMHRAKLLWEALMVALRVMSGQACRLGGICHMSWMLKSRHKGCLRLRAMQAFSSGT